MQYSPLQQILHVRHGVRVIKCQILGSKCLYDVDCCVYQPDSNYRIEFQMTSEWSVGSGKVLGYEIAFFTFNDCVSWFCFCHGHIIIVL